MLIGLSGCKDEPLLDHKLYVILVAKNPHCNPLVGIPYVTCHKITVSPSLSLSDDEASAGRSGIVSGTPENISQLPELGKFAKPPNRSVVANARCRILLMIPTTRGAATS